MQKNKILALILLLIVVSGLVYYFYSQNQSVKKLANSYGIMVGGDKDEHGCIGSAGYTWSVLKQSCIRLFEVGIPLQPKDDSLDQNLLAYIIFKSQTDYQIGELYLPNKATPTMITFSGGIWADQDGNYKLFEQGKEMFLIDGGNRLIYATADPK